MAQANHAPLTFYQEEAAKKLTNYMRKKYRRQGFTGWADLDGVLLNAKRMKFVGRQDAVQAALYSQYRGGNRFRVWWANDPASPDGNQYFISLNPHLHTNKDGN